MNTVISVIIPVYNGENTLLQALQSVVQQALSVEIVVVDDCSTDHTKDIVEDFRQQCLKETPEVQVLYIKNQSNLGVAQSRMAGVAQSKGQWIAFLDADDYWMPGKLKAQFSAVTKSGAVLCCTSRQLVTPWGEDTNRIIPVKEHITYKDLLFHNSIVCSSVLVKREAIMANPMSHDDSHEDYISWLKILKQYGEAIGINKPYCCYRLSSNSKSGNKLKSAQMTFKVYRYMGFGIIKSCFLFLSYSIHGIAKYAFIKK